MGNLASVQKALAFIGHDSVLTSRAEDIKSSDKLVLPGVGAFGAAMQNLSKMGLVEPVRDYCASGRPFFGICLGMQLLMSSSTELGQWDGLGIVPGKVVRFFEGAEAPAGIKVPHMGWNGLEVRQRSGLLDGLGEQPSVYFVHSYYVVPDDEEVVAASCTHGERFCAAIARGNVWATQFHPEKSGAAGLAMLRNFADA